MHDLKTAIVSELGQFRHSGGFRDDSSCMSSEPAFIGVWLSGTSKNDLELSKRCVMFSVPLLTEALHPRERDRLYQQAQARYAHDPENWEQMEEPEGQVAAAAAAV